MMAFAVLWSILIKVAIVLSSAMVDLFMKEDESMGGVTALVADLVTKRLWMVVIYISCFTLCAEGAPRRLGQHNSQDDSSIKMLCFVILFPLVVVGVAGARRVLVKRITRGGGRGGRGGMGGRGGGRDGGRSGGLDEGRDGGRDNDVEGGGLNREGEGGGDGGGDGAGEDDDETVHVKVFERKERDESSGHFPNKPKEGQPKYGEVHFKRTHIVDPVHKKTLKAITRAHWPSKPVDRRGNHDEKFLSDVIHEFRDYYDYGGVSIEEGDRVVRKHVIDNLKHSRNYAKTVADKLVASEPRKTRLYFKPSYFSVGAWESLCKWWDSKTFKEMSEINSKNRQKNQLVHTTGATPICVKLDEWEAAEGPLDPVRLFEKSHNKKNKPQGTYCTQKTKELKDDIKKLWDEYVSQQDPTCDPLPVSPSKRRKLELEISLGVTGGPKKGRILLHPRLALSDVPEGDTPSRWTQARSNKSSAEPSSSTSLDEAMIDDMHRQVFELVDSLGDRHTVTRDELNEELNRLANGAISNTNDLTSQALRREYIKHASTLLTNLLRRNKKVITEGTRPDKVPMLSSDEDEEQEAENLNYDC